jgi:eukaryotic-like serine/threonine-protein kinase
MPADTSVCPSCKTELKTLAPEGLCPKCLLERALAPANGADSNATAIPDPSAVPTTPFTGIRLRYFGDYELLEEIARGGMGIVFKARQVNLNRFVALKLINAGAFAGEAMVKRFKAEAEAAAALSHPNIVPIYEIGEVQGQHYFSMGLIDGPNLADVLAGSAAASGGGVCGNPKYSAVQEQRNSDAAAPGTVTLHYRYDVKDAVQLIISVTRAVHHAHQRGVLHRDIKPSNILIDKNGTAHLTDFGIAKLTHQETTLTQTQAILGTPVYMAPEQACGDAKNVTTAADLYALGAVFYETLTASPPFTGKSSVDIIRQVLEDEPRRPSTLNPAVDCDLETICLKCLQKEPRHRYASAEAFAEDLDRWQRGEPIEARPVTSFERLAKWTKRKPLAAAFGAVSILAMTALFGIAVSVPAYRNAERARYKELVQRHRAEAAQKTEVEARRKETEQRFIAQAALAGLERADYVKNLNLAEREWLAGDSSSAENLLDECPSELRGWEWDYIKRLCYSANVGTNRFPFPADGDDVYNVAFTGNGTNILAQGARGVTLANLSNREAVFHRATPSGMGRLALNPVTSWIAYGQVQEGSTFAGGRTAALDLSGAQEIVLDETNIYDLAFSPDGKTVLMAQGSGPSAHVTLRDFPSGLYRHTFAESKNGFMAVRFSPDGKLFAAAESSWTESHFPSRYRGALRRIHVWRTDTRELVHSLEGHEYGIWRLAFTPDSQRLASASGPYSGAAPGEIKIWDIVTGKEVLNLKGQKGCVFSIAISADGKRLAAGDGAFGRKPDRGADVHIWDLREGSELLSLKSHAEAIYDVVFSPSGTHLAAASRGAGVVIWDATPVPRERQIDLSGRFNAVLSEIWGLPPARRPVGFGRQGSTLADLPRGLQRLAGVRFSIRGVIQIKGRKAEVEFPDRVQGIAIQQTCRKIHFLHATYSVVPDGTEIARYIVHYADGKDVSIPVLYGEDLREWRLRSDSSPTISRGEVAWSINDVDDTNRLFRSTWTNTLSDGPIESLDFVSTMTDCFPFLLAITVE